ncbi:hypothetical protein [Vibrio sp. 10N.222.54.B11]|uniref:hypothetical protein n=1 Tax=Vibrio sp. 10N.222.54.B11 TaxID=3229635 RepID=UPI00354DB558
MYKLIILSLLLVSTKTLAYEFTAPLEKNAQSQKQYAASTGATSYRLAKRNPSCEKDCRVDLVSNDRRVISGNFNPGSSIFVSAYYRDISWAIVREPYKNEKGRNRHRYMRVNSKGQKQQQSVRQCRYATEAEMTITHNGILVCAKDDVVHMRGPGYEREFTLPESSFAGAVNNNLAGTTAIAFVGRDSFNLYTTNVYKLMSYEDTAWDKTLSYFHPRSDSNQVLTVYPENRTRTIVAAYEYINVLNKGLNLYYFQDGKEPIAGHFFNSARVNIGHEPEIYVAGRDVIIRAKNSSIRDRQSWKISLDDLQNNVEDQFLRYSHPAKIDLLAGYGLTHTDWSINQRIKDNNKETVAKTSYRMNDENMETYYFQGRIGETQISLRQLTNEGKDHSNGNVSKGTKMLTGVVDFHGFFDGANTLRLEFDTLESGGVAHYSDVNGTLEPFTFETEYTNIDILLMGERGGYWGFSYSDYHAPSAVGFFDRNGRIAGTAFDENFDIKSYMFKIGYNEAAYGARYETSYSRFYNDIGIGIGLSKLSVDRDALEAATGDRHAKLSGRNRLALTGELEIGYIWQKRFHSMRAAGFSLQAGYRAKADMLIPMYGDAKGDDNGYELAYERSDIWHGPFVQFNAVW